MRGASDYRHASVRAGRSARGSGGVRRCAATWALAHESAGVVVRRRGQRQLDHLARIARGSRAPAHLPTPPRIRAVRSGSDCARRDDPQPAGAGTILLNGAWRQRDRDARSTLDSRQAWSAQHNNTSQWLTIDAGKKAGLIGGVVVQTRGHSHRSQYVTRLRVSVSSDGGSFVEVDDGKELETGCERDDDTQRFVRFAKPVDARF
eukprot:3768665-Prymnesium_polylepis.1